MGLRQRALETARTLLPGCLALGLALSTVGTALAEVHVVQPGDTLYEISLNYGVDVDDLAAANGIGDPSTIQVGQEIYIPGSSGAGKSSSAAGGVYTVVPGDTLLGIADEFGVSLSSLLAANGLSEYSIIQVGQQLRIPGGTGAAPAATTASASGSGTYVVSLGDTLSAIAGLFGVSSHAIASANGISDPDSLQVGQRLTIPARPELSARGGERLSFIWPAYGEITGYFHEVGPWWRLGYHEGLDLGTGYGAAVMAAEAGTVIEADYGWNSGYGTYIKIDHGNGIHTLYGHLSELYVEPWEQVARGEVIGLTGNTGASTGPHLHFEVRVGGAKVDPLTYLP